MKVIEYRKKHPNCKYCNHYIDFNYCLAKEKCLFFNEAKKCPMYLAKGIITDVEE